MTKEKWLACNDPSSMLGFLWHNGSDRKLRLFACDCCIRVKHVLVGEQSLHSIVIAERHADGLATDDELGEATESLSIVPPAGRPYPNAPAYYATWEHAPDACISTAEAAIEALRFAGGDFEGERDAQVASVHEIFGPLPYHLIVTNPTWLTSIVQSLATAIYDDKAFDHLPILADALQEAGCDNDDILNHLRGPGPHVRGCWALDLVLGKA